MSIEEETLEAWGGSPEWCLELVQVLYRDLARSHGGARRRESGLTAGGLLEWGRLHLPEHFSRPPSAMHKWLARRLDGLADCRGTKLNVLGPRGGAKSTIGTLAYPLRAALDGHEPYIWIVSDTHHQASAHLENIKNELLDNRRLAEAYPEAVGRGPVWSSGAIRLANGVTIEAFGTGQRIRGRRRRENRPTLIICDDLQNDGHTHSAWQRERSRSWFHGTLIKAGTPDTNVLNLATALHREALAMELSRTAGWHSRIFHSIQRWPKNLALWAQWEALYTDVQNRHYREDARSFYEQQQAAMEEGALVLWPELEDLYTLMCMRAESGHAAFEREKQNSPINPDLCEWPESYFDESIWFDAWPAELKVKTLALDPSKGSDARRGDFSAFVLLGVDRQGMLYVQADMARRSVPEIIAQGVELCAQARPDAFGVESNQFQDLLGAEFEAEFLRQGLLGVRPWLMDNHVNKQVRIRRIGPYLSGRRMRFKAESPATRLLVDQLREFPVGDHDDGPDALEMAIRLAGDLLSGVPAADSLGARLPVGL